MPRRKRTRLSQRVDRTIRRKRLFEPLESRILWATVPLTGLPNHAITVEVPNGRILSQAPNPGLQFDVIRSGGATISTHGFGISATRDDGQSQSTPDFPTGTSTVDVPLTVQARPGNNVYRISFERTTVPVGTVQLAPTIEIYRNRIAASDQDVATNDNEPIVIDLSPSQDADGDDLTIRVTQLPSNGRLEQINGIAISENDVVTDAAKRVRFIPKVDSSGNRTFQFQANDGFENSPEATVSIAITDAPPNPPSPPNLLAEADSGPSFVAGANTDDLTHGIEPDRTVLRFVVENLQPGAIVQLLRDGAQTGDSAFDDDSDGAVTVEAPVGGATGTFVFTAIQFDSNFNPSQQSGELSVAIDVTKPDARNFRLTQQQPSALPVPIPVNANPTIRFDLTEQIFAGKDNRVQLRLFDSATNSPLGLPRVESFQTGSQGTRTIEMSAPLGSLTGSRTIRMQATDAANNVATFNFPIFVLDVGDATVGAPNTPVYTTLFNLRGAVDQGGNLLFTDPADRLFPWQTSFDKTTQTTWFSMEQGNRLGQFDPATGLVRVYDLDVLNGFVRGSRSSVNNPHGVFFDFNSHLTPRVWFVHRAGIGPDSPNQESDMDDPARLSYLDLVKNELVTYDFEDPAMMAVLAAHGLMDPVVNLHAVFVDPRGDVWAVSEGGNQLLQFDFQRSVGGGVGLDSRDATLVVRDIPTALSAGGEAFHPHGIEVIVDERTGEQFVWFISEGGSGRVSLLRPGRSAALASASLAGSSHIRITDFAAPGSQITVAAGQSNEETRTVLHSTGSGIYTIELDRPLDFDHSAGAKVAVGNDRWTAWDASIGEGTRGTFVKVDDQETPGDPYDDTIVGTFPVNRPPQAGGVPANTMGIVYELNPNFEQDGLESPSATIRSWTIPSVSGAGSALSAINQPFIDREGELYFIDRLGGVGRFDPGEISISCPAAGTLCLSSTTQVPAISFAAAPPEAISLEPTPVIIGSETLTALPIDRAEQLNASTLTIGRVSGAATQAGINDRSSLSGLDLYEVAAPSGGTRGQGQGPFRGFLNATNVLYGSLAQSDFLSTTVFAETARRQMDVVVKPGVVANGATQGRMAFSVERDGSLIATVRGAGNILDEQINLSKLKGGEAPAARFLFDGEANAVINNTTGLVSVFGINHDNDLVVFQFTGGMEAWTNSGLTSAANWTVSEPMGPPAGSLLVGEPTGFIGPAGQAGAVATTDTGHVVVYWPVGAGAIDLTAQAANPLQVFSSVAMLGSGTQTIAYGTNMKGDMIQYSFTLNAATGLASGVVARTLNETRPASQSPRDTQVFQDVYAVPQGQIHHVFGVDGNSRLVHFEVNVTTAEVHAENVTETVQDLEQVFGYFPFQQSPEAPFGGRVYAEVGPTIAPDGTLFVYGTNGQDLIEFQRPAGGTWQVANLTNDIYSTSGAIGGPNRGGPGQPPAQRVPANAVFGAPTAYTLPNGERHTLQINADGEVVEYYYQNVAGSYSRFQTQNITLRLAPSGANDVYRTAPGQALVVSAAGGVLANDSNQSKLTPAPSLDAHQVTVPAGGMLKLNADGSFTYTPKPGFLGTDTFFYQARTDLGESPAVQVSIIVEPIVAGTIIDDGRPGYSQKGTWLSQADAASFEGDLRHNAPGTGKDAATWTFTKLPAGEYEVFTRWSAGALHADNAPYTIFDNSRVVGGRLVDQTQPPQGEMAAGFAWHSLGTVSIASGTLKVTLTDKANGAVIADAVRVVRRSLETTLDDGMFGFSQRGSWKTRTSNAAVGGDFRESAKGAGQDLAEWKFTELPDGEYEVFTHWVAGTNRASNAPYSVYDNTFKLSTRSVNQKVAPTGALFEGFRWHSLGTVNITSGVLKVTLSDKANGLVIADAVRIAPASGSSALAVDSALLALFAPPPKGRRR